MPCPPAVDSSCRCLVDIWKSHWFCCHGLQSGNSLPKLWDAIWFVCSTSYLTITMETHSFTHLITVLKMDGRQLRNPSDRVMPEKTDYKKLLNLLGWTKCLHIGLQLYVSTWSSKHQAPHIFLTDPSHFPNWISRTSDWVILHSKDFPGWLSDGPWVGYILLDYLRLPIVTTRGWY